MRFLPIISIAYMVLLGSCNTTTDNKDSTVTTFGINLKTLCQNQVVVPGSYYQLKGSDSIMISRLDYYLSDFNASSNSGTKEGDEIFLYRIANTENRIKIQSGFPLSMTGFGFLVGLNDINNAKNPTDFNASHPLSSTNNMYWNEWTKYRYIVFEGKLKSAGIEKNFVYHTGLDYRNRTTMTKNIILTVGKDSFYNLYLNIDKIFYPNSGNNISYNGGELQTHANPSESALTTKFAQNFSEAFNME